MTEVSRYQGNRQWALLLLVGAVIVIGAVVLQGIATAASPEAAAQRAEERPVQAGVFDMLSGAGSRIGVRVDDVKSGAIGMPDEGASVQTVYDQGPAADAGLQEGDVVVEFDEERVRGASQLSRLVRETPAGREVTAVVVRDGQRVRLNVTPETGSSVMGTIREYWPDIGHFSSDFGLRPRGPRLGVEVSELSPQLAAYFGVEAGVLVTSVEPGSVADAATLRAGDVVLAIGDEPVNDIRSLRRRVGRLDSPATFSIEIMRDRREIALEGQIDDAPPTAPHRRVQVTTHRSR